LTEEKRELLRNIFEVIKICKPENYDFIDESEWCVVEDICNTMYFSNIIIDNFGLANYLDNLGFDCEVR
jgi:hypothetical protein